MMAAKATTPEQANQFHLAMTGHEFCFEDCCLCKATDAVVLLQLEVTAIGSELLILQQENIHWKLYAEDMHKAVMEEDTSYANEAWIALPDDLRDHLDDSLEMDLSVFTNDYEWVIAKTLAQALRIVKETTGYEYPEDETGDWYELSDENILSIWWEDDRVAEIGTGTLVEKPCGEWIEQIGKGYLCSSEM